MGTLHPSQSVNAQQLIKICLAISVTFLYCTDLLHDCQKVSERENIFCQQFISKFETFDGAGGGSIASLPKVPTVNQDFFGQMCSLVGGCQKLSESEDIYVKKFGLKL